MKAISLALILTVLAAGVVYATQIEPANKEVISCTVCTTAVEIIDSKLLANATIEEIEKVVIGICDFLTGIEDDCRNFIHEQLPIVITLLVEQYLDPTEICTMLTLCP